MAGALDPAADSGFLGPEDSDVHCTDESFHFGSFRRGVISLYNPQNAEDATAEVANLTASSPSGVANLNRM